MFRNGFYLEPENVTFDMSLMFDTSPMVGYVDPYSGEKVLYKKSEQKKGPRMPKSILDTVYQQVQTEYDEKNGDTYKRDRDVNKKRLNDIKSILIESKKKREVEFEEFYAYSVETIESFVDQKDKDRLHARYARQKRFLRRGFFNRDKWQYFCTFTWDGEKFETAEEWQKSILRFFGNVAFRHGAKFLGAFEKGDDNDRLHFHCLLSDPEGYFSDFEKKTTFSKKDKKYKKVLQNITLREKFGINDFEVINAADNDDLRHTILYTSYYTIENDGRLYISRGLPTDILQYVNIKDTCYYAGEEGVFKFLARPDYEWDFEDFGKEKTAMRKTLYSEKYIFKDVS